LKDIDCPLAGDPMIMDPADEGDTTQHLALDLMYLAVVPAKSNRLDPWEYDQELEKREMKWKDCSAGGRDLAGSSLAGTSWIGCFLLSGSWC